MCGLIGSCLGRQRLRSAFCSSDWTGTQALLYQRKAAAMAANNYGPCPICHMDMIAAEEQSLLRSQSRGGLAAVFASWPALADSPPENGGTAAREVHWQTHPLSDVRGVGGLSAAAIGGIAAVAKHSWRTHRRLTFSTSQAGVSDRTILAAPPLDSSLGGSPIRSCGWRHQPVHASVPLRSCSRACRALTCTTTVA